VGLHDTSGFSNNGTEQERINEDVCFIAEFAKDQFKVTGGKLGDVQNALF